jgi:hypothetical protein
LHLNAPKAKNILQLLDIIVTEGEKSGLAKVYEPGD